MTFRCAGVRRTGTATSRVTSRSPVRPLPGTPRPRTRRVRPLAVPGGTLSETVPSSVGTVSVVPSAASANVIGTVSVRSASLRPNSACSATWTTTNRSPAGPPRRPGAPLPASRMRWPSLTPEGMRTVIVRVWLVIPLPEQVGQLPGLCIRSGTVTPRTASSKESVASVSTS
jgi:hypothetical protein